MGCLFPGVGTPVRNTSAPSSFDKGQESDANIRTEMNSALDKRGMKFSHVSIGNRMNASAIKDFQYE